MTDHIPTTATRVVSGDALASTVATLLGQQYQPYLVAAHGDLDHIRVVYVMVRASDDSRVEVHVLTDCSNGQIPSLAGLSFPIGRFEREIRDLYGVTPTGHPMPYRLVRHAHWPRGWYPMLSEATVVPAFDHDAGTYPFTPVEGAGVYEIPVGPVHAGLIEPGHFRFSVVGETILHMKARLWFLHRGIEKLFQGRSPHDGIEQAERISGDTAVGHTLAYCIAVEQALHLDVPEPAQLQRALLLELERIYNHIGDLGAMANDVGFSFANTHALRLREAMLRLNHDTTGHRLLRGGIVIGGAHLRQLPDPALLQTIGSQVDELVDIILSKSTIMDRFTDTATLSHDAAQEIGTLGYVARASGIDQDARRDHPFTALPDTFQTVTEDAGDVLARYTVRVRELAVLTATRPEPGQEPRRTQQQPDRRPHQPTGQQRAGTRRGLARTHRAPHRTQPRRHASQSQNCRSIIPQLARPVRRAGRYHRPRLPPRQQELQPVLRRQRPLTCSEGQKPSTGLITPPRTHR